ncbi:MAG: RHS repeat protein, partial [Candidatus Dadabacteria bacterium]
MRASGRTSPRHRTTFLVAALVTTVVSTLPTSAFPSSPGYGGLSFTELATPDLLLPAGVRIHPRSGNISVSVPLFSRPAWGIPVELLLHYSHDRRRVPSPYGHGWWPSVAARTGRDTAGNIHITWGDGHHDVLQAPGYAPPATHPDWQVTLSGSALQSIRTGRGIRYTFSTTSGLLTRVEDPDQQGITISYDARGRVTAVTHDNGRTWTWSYGGDGRLIRITEDAAGRIWQFGYDADGNLISATDPAGRAHGFGYDADHRLTTRLTSDGRTGTLRWGTDGSALVPDQYTFAGSVWQFSWNASDRTLQQIDPVGAQWTFALDAAGRVTGVADPDKNWTRYLLDTVGRPTQITDALGNAFTITWDARGNLVSTASPAGETSTIVYNSGGYLPIIQYDAAGQPWRNAFDTAGRPIAITDPLGQSLRTVYDAHGLPIAVTDASGRTATITYDNLGRPVAMDAGDGQAILYSYDAADRLVAVTDPTGVTIQFVYDAIDNVIAILRNGTPVMRRYYDTAGNVTAVSDGMGRMQFFQYDTAGNLAAAVAPDGGTTRWLRDALGNVTMEIDPMGRAAHYTYDLNGRLREMTDTAGRVSRYIYDAAGQLIERRDGADQPLVTWTYDSAGRPSRIVWSSRLDRSNFDAITLDYHYDGVGNITEAVEQTDFLGSPRTSRVRVWYDAAGRVTASSTWIADPTASLSVLTTRYSYDGAGRLKTLQLPSAEWLGDTANNVQIYNYDAAGRPMATTTIAIHSQAGLTSQTVLSWYDAAGRVTGTSTRVTPDAEIQQLRYIYDAAGRVTQIDERGGAAANPAWQIRTRYWYDAADQVTLVAWTYDPVGGTDPFSMGVITSSTWLYRDAAGRLTGQVEARTDNLMSSGSVWFWQRDASGLTTGGVLGPDLVSAAPFVVTRNADGTVYEYWDTVTGLSRFFQDPWGRVTAEVLPDQNTTINYSYDAKSRLVQLWIWKSGTVGAVPTINLAYDALNRLSRYDVRYFSVGPYNAPVNHGARLAYGSPRPVEAIVYDVYSTTDPYHNKDRNAVYTYDRPAQNQPADLQAVSPSHRSSTQANFGSWGNAVNGGACLTGPGGCTGGEVTSFGGMADMTLWPASPFGDPFANPFVEAPVPTQNSEAKWNQWPFLMVPAGPALSSPQAAAPSALLAPTTISLQGLTTG